ncbi:helix-turn-helix domain-containing protein [Rhizobium grahamii]|uniref:Crp/Fnr family transcriptional regulator n=1 Tax=Rhizobium grahamii TaxID=1120045 RepID=A0A370KIV8_9HYPH|nr:helix-turn-helix domain-containing protein [Rhizobium grahamii]RDJ05823.1 Crp/Fnr family transcriptional regulator [Rhizobium grahamii]
MIRSRGALEGKPILVVEDDYYTATALAFSLRQQGVEVVGPSPSIDDAFKKIRQTTDLAGVVLDVNLGGEMVFPVADELHRMNIPFLFATGYEPNIIPARFRDRILLRKPLEDDAVIAALLSTASPQSVSRHDVLRNKVLRLLPQREFSELLPYLRKLHLPRGAVLETPNQVVERVLFPLDCVLSLTTVGAAGTRFDIAFVGNEGMTGSGIALYDDITPYELINRVDGDVLAISVDDFRIALETSPTLRTTSARFERSICIQIGQAALAAGRFEIPTRLARWILMIQDRSGRDSLEVTHDTVAASLGVRRPSITAAMHILEGELLIRSTRSTVLIRDRDGLVEFAGEAYGTPEAAYRRLLPVARSNGSDDPPADSNFSEHERSCARI